MVVRKLLNVLTAGVLLLAGVAQSQTTSAVSSVSLKAMKNFAASLGSTTTGTPKVVDTTNRVLDGKAPPTFKHPLSKTDFKFQGQPTRQKDCGSLVQDPAEAKQLTEACLNIYQELLKAPEIRKNNLAAALAFLIGSSMEILSGEEISDEHFTALQRALNDLLVDGGVMTKMKPADIQGLYELSLMLGGFAYGVYQNGTEDGDQEMIDSAKVMARGFLEALGFQPD